jgi:hypothetical protein
MPFLSISREMAGEYTQLGSDRFLSYSIHHQQQQQRLICSDVRRTDLSISSVADHSLFPLNGIQTASEELLQLAFLKYILNNYLAIIVLILLGQIYLVLV